MILLSVFFYFLAFFDGKTGLKRLNRSSGFERPQETATWACDQMKSPTRALHTVRAAGVKN